MKKNFLIIMMVALCAGCDDVQVKEKDLEAAGEKLQKTVKKGVDTIGAKLEKLKDKIEDNSEDSIK